MYDLENFSPRIMQVKMPEKEGLDVDEFSISEDFDLDSADTYPVFLVVPDKNKFDHYHIKISPEGAKELYNWLRIYLRKREIYLNDKYSNDSGKISGDV